MTDNSNDEEYVLCFAWYSRKQWSLLNSVSTDSDKLESSYDEWLDFAENRLAEMRAHGADIKKVDVDVEELIDWAEEQDIPIDGAARASFTAHKAQQQAQEDPDREPG